MIFIFQDDLLFKNKEIPRTILGSATFTAEGYFGHRSILYQLDLEKNVKAIAKLIKDSFDLGVEAINLTTNSYLIEAFKESQKNGVQMKVIGTIGKTKVDYLMPDYKKAIKANWKKDIEILSKFDTPIMLIDEFITDSYDWDLLKEILTEIKKNNALAGIITSFPFKTTKKLLKSPILDLFDFYMIPINKLGYMIDTESFLQDERKNLAILLEDLNKKVIASKLLACGIQEPNEAFKFLKEFNEILDDGSNNNHDYLIDMIAIGIANEEEAKLDFKALKEI